MHPSRGRTVPPPDQGRDLPAVKPPSSTCPRMAATSVSMLGRTATSRLGQAPPLSEQYGDELPTPRDKRLEIQALLVGHRTQQTRERRSACDPTWCPAPCSPTTN